VPAASPALDLENPPRGLTATERVRLSFEVLALYLRVRWLLVRHGAVPTVTALRRGLQEPDERDADRTLIVNGLQFGRAVAKVLRLIPADGRCLMRSFVLTGMLARRGVYGRVVIGVQPEPHFGAHAWVEIGGHPLLATDEETFRRLVEL
jgi:Transglutaminase-like superfamily